MNHKANAAKKFLEKKKNFFLEQSHEPRTRTNQDIATDWIDWAKNTSIFKPLYYALEEKRLHNKSMNLSKFKNMIKECEELQAAYMEVCLIFSARASQLAWNNATEQIEFIKLYGHHWDEDLKRDRDEKIETVRLKHMQDKDQDKGIEAIYYPAYAGTLEDLVIKAAKINNLSRDQVSRILKEIGARVVDEG